MSNTETHITLLSSTRSIIAEFTITHPGVPEVIIYKGIAFKYWSDEMYIQADTLIIKE